MVAQVKPAEKVRVVEELTRDEQVAAEAAAGLLRRPDVAFKAMADDYPDYEPAARVAITDQSQTGSPVCVVVDSTSQPMLRMAARRADRT
ncbi:DUF6192 family protein [Embleya sp. NPDC050493]|uniref:DUF6192 family protein n=1 Tax=Embleya sp. NPDC050493 TaxID=3363989 RepID=UPI0037BA9792